MTFHIIPWMWGVDGNKTCGISDTIYVTDTGIESFFTLDKDFVVHDTPSQSAQPRSSKARQQAKQRPTTDLNIVNVQEAKDA